MRPEPSSRLLKDEQQGSATHDREHSSVKPPMQLVQTLQILHKVLCVRLGSCLPEGNERIGLGHGSHEGSPKLSLMAALARCSRTEALLSLIPSARAISLIGMSSK